MPTNLSPALHLWVDSFPTHGRTLDWWICTAPFIPSWAPQSASGTIHVPSPEHILSLFVCGKKADKSAWKRKQNSKFIQVSLISSTNALLQLLHVDAFSCWLRNRRELLFFEESSYTYFLNLHCDHSLCDTLTAYLSLFTSAQIRSTHIPSALEDAWFPFPQCWKQSGPSFICSLCPLHCAHAIET